MPRLAGAALRRSRCSPGFIHGLLAALLLLAPLTADPAAAQRSRDFLLATPKVALRFNFGFAQPRAGSGDGTQSLWDLTREQLTLDTRDFGGLAFHGEIAARLSERADLTFTLGHSYSESRSEFRNWVDTDDLPIEQTTEFSTTPLTVGVRAYLFDRGRSLGRFAYIPNRLNAYLGVAGGLAWYRFYQYGDFVDFETLDIFTDSFLSRGRGATLHFSGGTEWGIGRQVLLVAEGRYQLASAPLDSDFVGFPNLDLSGFQLTAGISLVY